MGQRQCAVFSSEYHCPCALTISLRVLLPAPPTLESLFSIELHRGEKRWRQQQVGQYKNLSPRSFSSEARRSPRDLAPRFAILHSRATNRDLQVNEKATMDSGEDES